jgi:hypothetical protein
MLRLLAACAALVLSLPFHAHGDAVLESATKDVRLMLREGARPVAVWTGQRVVSGNSILTGADGTALLRFDDGQKVVLGRESELAVLGSHYRESAPALDRAELALKRGTLRTVTGAIARRNAEAVVVRTPHVNLGVRGSDFSVTIMAVSYWSVNDGGVIARTNVSTGVFGSGSYGHAASLDAPAAGMSSSGLPAAVAAAFNQMHSPQVTALLGASPGGAMAAAPPAAPSSANGGIGTLGMVGILAGVAAALAAAGGGGGSSATQH